MLTIRPATPADVPLVVDCIRELGQFHGLPGPFRPTREGVGGCLFGPEAFLHSELAFWDDVPAGQALWHLNFASWEGRPGLHLEDLLVRPEFRSHGIGRALMVHLAALALDRGWCQVTWQAVDWNAAGIRFYTTLGAERITDWATFRLAGDALERLAGRTP
jgi:diamine N-acetyltransferase